MNAQQLKNSILQEAIEGRLVPQDPNDEPASVLLDKIRAEKKRLVKEGKLKKKDLEETPISEDEKPFEIPKSWEWCKLGTIAAVLGGKRIPAGRKLSVENTGHIYIRVSDMKDNTVSTDNLQYVPEDIFPSISRYIIKKEDVYITVAGTIGRVGKIPPELDGANLTENADRLIFSLINQDWLIKCLESNIVQTQIIDVTTKVGQPKLAILRIQTLLIPLPPLSEQHRIVAKIEELLPKVEEYGKAQESLDKLNEELPERLKKSILQEAIEGRLVPQDPNDEPASVLLDKIRKEKAKLVKEGKLILSKPEKKVNNKEVEDLNLPETWTLCQINDICRTFGRIGFRGYTKDDLRSSPKDGAITLSPTNINNGTLDLTSCTYLSWEKYEESPEIQVAEGDIILVKTASIGKCALINEVKHEMTVNPQFVVLKDIKIFNKYLFYLILSPYVQDKIKNYAIGTSIPTYSQVSLISMKIPLPPLAEQKRIVEKLEQLLHEIEKLKV